MSSSFKKFVALYILITLVFTFIPTKKVEASCVTDAQERLVSDQANLASLNQKRQELIDSGKSGSIYDNAIKSAQQIIDQDNKMINGQIPCSGFTAANWGASIVDVTWKSAKNLADFGVGLYKLKDFGVKYAILRAIILILGVLVLFAGALFDLVVSFTIAHMGILFDTGGALSLLWEFTRDIVNISLIFLLLYYAISMIIGSWNYKAKTSIVSIIITAIFINFSLFITKVLIDISNIFATVFFNQMSNHGLRTISTIIFEHLDMKVLLTDTISVFFRSGQMNLMALALIKIALLAAMLWAFYIATWLLIGRFCMFLFLAITSPVAYIGGLFAGTTDKLKKDWWDVFISQAMVAPILFFFWMIVVRLLDATGSSQTTWFGGIDAALNSVGGFLDTRRLFYNIVIIVLLIKGTKLAREWSGKTGEMAIKIGNLVSATAASTAVTAALGSKFVSQGLRTAQKATAGAQPGTIMNRLNSNITNARRGLVTAKRDGSIKNFRSDFLTGKVDKQPGIIGDIARYTGVRGTLIGNLKDATGGWIDVKKLEKQQSDDKTRILKAEDKKIDGEVKSEVLEKITELENKRQQIDAQATAKTNTELSDIKKVLIDSRDAQKKNFEQKRIDLDNARRTGNPQLIQKAEKEFTQANQALLKSEKTVVAHDKREKATIQEHAKEIATAQGDDWDVVKKTGTKKERDELQRELSTNLKKEKEKVLADEIRKMDTMSAIMRFGPDYGFTLGSAKRKSDLAKEIEEGKTGDKTLDQLIADRFEQESKKNTPPAGPKTP